MQELKKELETILPKDHPFLKKLNHIPTGADGENLIEEVEILGDPDHMTEVLARLIWMIDDWKRGIRDWSEVENELVYAREAII